MTGLLLSFALLMFFLAVPDAARAFETDGFDTSAGKLEITFIGHGSLMFANSGKIVHVDPYSEVADYSKLPKADLVLITHEHRDHLDQKALESVRTSKTAVVVTEACAQQVKGGIVMHNGDVKTVEGFRIEAVPAYNLVHMRSEGVPYHPKGVGNGYIISFGDKKVYVAGDTENTPEMKGLKGIDIAFLPMNLPYTMTPAMVADAAKAFKPKILYPYHTGNTDTAEIGRLMKDTGGVEVRVRSLK